jgi:hypothetical protein
MLDNAQRDILRELAKGKKLYGVGTYLYFEDDKKVIVKASTETVWTLISLKLVKGVLDVPSRFTLTEKGIVELIAQDIPYEPPKEEK